MENSKESISFNFGRDIQKQNFLNKTKKYNIIPNNNSVFLHKILSVKNETLLNYTLKKNSSEYFKKIKSSTDNKKGDNKNNTNSSFHRNKKIHINKNLLQIYLKITILIFIKSIQI